MYFNPEEVDLLQLAAGLRRCFGPALAASYLRGKTLMRDAVVVQLGCSVYEAEQLVETLETQGYIRFPQLADDTHPADWRRWLIEERPA
jgi:hypothetical protein